MAVPKSSESPLAWTRSESGSFSRPLDGLEAFFNMLTQMSPTNEHWAISVNLKLGFPNNLSDSETEAALRRAWLLTCRRHPGLTGTLDPGSTAPTLVVESFDDPKDDDETGSLLSNPWLERTFLTLHDDDGATVEGQDPFTVLRNTGGPTCHWLPATRELHIRCQHWRIDGIGSLMLADSFLSTLASVLSSDVTVTAEKGNDVAGSGLTPSLFALVNDNLDEATTPSKYKDVADSLVFNFIQGVPSINLPSKPGSEDAAPVAESGRETVTMSVAETEAVVAACKKRAINVASAVHVALVRVTATYPQHPLSKSYAAFFPIDMRRHLPDSVDKSKLVLGDFSSGLPVRVPDVLDGKSFDAIASELNAVYAGDLARPRANSGDADEVTMLKLAAPYLRRTTQLFATPPPAGLPPMQTPDLSTLGKVEQYVKRSYTSGSDENNKVEVENIWLGTQMMTRQLQCHVWTFRDQLSVQGCFNSAFYEKDFVIEVLNKLKAELLSGLGVLSDGRSN